MSTRYRNYFKLWKVILSFVIPFALIPLALNDDVVILFFMNLTWFEKRSYLTQTRTIFKLLKPNSFLINSHFFLINPTDAFEPFEDSKVSLS